MTDYDNVKKQIETIQDHGRDLTEWENNFVKSVVGQFKQRGWLSPKQLEIIDRIYTQKTPTGTVFGEGGVTGVFSSEQERTNRVRNEGRVDIPGGKSGWRAGLREKYGDADDI